MKKLHLAIDGMSCGHCVSRVNKTLSALPGVRIAQVDVGSADLEFDPSLLSIDRITGVLDEAGYPARASEAAQ